MHKEPLTHIHAHPLVSECVSGGRLFANREEMVRRLLIPYGGKIAEVGVAFGDFSDVLISACRPKLFFAFDLFGLDKVPEIWGKPTKEVLEGKTHKEYYRDRMKKFEDQTQIECIEGDSNETLSRLEDDSLDLIYIDGGHDLDTVMRDTKIAVRKLKSDGLIIFNDYIMFDHINGTPCGVVHVVNDLCVNHRWRIVGFAFQQDMFCDIALTKRPISID